MAGFGRVLMVSAAVAAGLGTVALRAQTALEDPRNAPKIFANTCSACHKSPQGLGKNGSASFLRQHYTTGPEMSAAMASYLASAGNGPAPKKSEKGKEASAPAKGTKREHITATHPLTDGTTDGRPSAREKQKAAKTETGKQGHTAPIPVERPAAQTPGPSATAALSTPAAPVREETAGPPVVTLDIPLPDMPTEPPADLAQPPAFSSAPLP